MSAPIRFLLNDELVELASCDPSATLLDFVREQRRLTGTKEGCREGDCGACTVVLATLQDDTVQARAVNSCILFLPALHGAAVYTVEGVRASDGSLHPIQQAMVDLHASQCGFCTPGFVMSLFAAWLTQASGDAAPDLKRTKEIISGNLCRCTGYGPILDAAKRALSQNEGAQQHCQRLQGALAQLDQGQMVAFEGRCKVTGARRSYAAPRSLNQLTEVLKAQPDAHILAGGTDLGLHVTKHHARFEALVDVTQVEELRQCEEAGGQLRIGAAVTLSQLREVLAERIPTTDPMLSRFASVPIRSRATIGGNIANGSPIGDLPPALIVLGARLELLGAKGKRQIAIEDFFIEYGRQDRQQGEVVTGVSVPLPREADHIAVFKISKRFEQDISAVLGAFFLQLEEDGRVGQCRIAYGGMAGTPKRARHAEAILIGADLSNAQIEQAANALAQDFEPLSDLRASAQYRMLTAQNLLRKFCLQVGGASLPQLETGAA